MSVSGEKLPLILIAGPTGVGKSDIAISLANKINGEIISADSVAVYNGLDIGSAKPDKDMRSKAPHHLIDILDPDEYFGVDEFIRYSKEAIDMIHAAGHIPIVVGGTAFYIQALLYDVDLSDEPEHDDAYRQSLYEEAEKEGASDTLYMMLADADPEYAATVHKNNVKRVIRALEYIHYTGRKFSEYNMEQSLKDSPYDFCYFALTADRELLYERIDRRVDIMMQVGLEDEVRGLLNKGYNRELNSMSSIGYKEMASYISGECDLDTAVSDIKKNSRHYAKRQLTWLKREKDVIMIDMTDKSADKAMEEMIGMIKEKGII